MFERIFSRIDWSIVTITILITGIGLIALASISPQMIVKSGNDPFSKQMGMAIVGILLIFVVGVISPKYIYNMVWPAYIFTLLLLILVLVMGKTGLGATRWIRIGPIQFQPSEFAKITVLLAFAKYLATLKTGINHMKPFFVSIAIVIVPWFLIFVEPDLGTSLAFLAFIFPVLYWAGFKPITIVLILYPALSLLGSINWYLLTGIFIVLLIILYFIRMPLWGKIAIVLGNIGMALLANPLWNMLKPYQQKRILTFLDPATDPKGAGYQVIQSMVTIGSGGIEGQGFQNGSQTQLGFIPEQHTDFIFTVLAEEFGFIGAFILLALFLVLIWRIVWIASKSKFQFFANIGIGVATLLSFHVLVNIGMTLGVMPVTGLPLPFISFGRSSLLTFMIMIGLIVNIHKHRLEY
jgi:rod shape determining protein RodA